MDDRSMHDGDFDYDEELHADAAARGRSLAVTNQPHDEEIALSDSDDRLGGASLDLDSSTNSLHGGEAPPKPSTPPASRSKPSYDDLAEAAEALGGQSKARDATLDQTRAANTTHTSGAAQQEPSQSKPQSSARITSPKPKGSLSPGAYDPAKYAKLSVEPAIRELFEYIGRYQPEKRDLDCHIKLFIPEYIPAVGDVDEFLKPPRPDGKPEVLGLQVLDEPAAKQSDPAIMRKHLKAVTKWMATCADDDNAIAYGDEDRDKKIDDWILNVSKLREAEHGGEFTPSGRFPPIDTLMQAWPEELENLVRKLRGPGSHVDVDVLTLAQTVCNLLDIPVYDNTIESLHCLFSLYAEMKNNPMLNPPDPNRDLVDGLKFVNRG